MSLRSFFELRGQVALVTGGSRGIGLQIAEGLGEMGARVCITARKPDELEQAVAHLNAQGIEAMAIRCNLSDPDAIAPMVDRIVSAWGQVDILVNNAGATWGAAAEDYPLDAWRKLIDLNILGMVTTSKLCAVGSMIPRRHGKIINITSIAGLRANPLGGNKTIAYNTTKAAQINYTRALAAEWGAFNINVNAIAPGFFPTRMTGDSPGLLDSVIARTPLPRVGGENDLKGLAVLLASAAGRHITGQIIAVDGGASVV